ncbi:MAG: periplasmic heavy metal sensor [Pseudomonadota bacterium]
MADGALGRGGRILLYVSLLVNLLVVGLVVGTLLVVSPKGQDRRPAMSGETGLGPLMLALEREDRRALALSMRRTLRGERLSRGEMRELARDIQGVLAAEPFDAQALDGVLDTQFSEATFRLDLARDLFRETLVEMTPEERAAYAARLGEVLDRRPSDERRQGPGGVSGGDD